MTTPFIGEIRMFGGNFAPVGWALCDGQLLQTSQNEPLFSVLGTIYGGDGRTTFGLPDLRGRIPLHQGSGLGLTTRPIGQRAGAETETVSVNQMPSHSHTAFGSTDLATDTSPGGQVLGHAGFDLYHSGAGSVPMAGAAIANTGGGQAHNNLMPTLCVSFIIALTGIFPTQT